MPRLKVICIKRRQTDEVESIKIIKRKKNTTDFNKLAFTGKVCFH